MKAQVGFTVYTNEGVIVYLKGNDIHDALQNADADRELLRSAVWVDEGEHTLTHFWNGQNWVRYGTRTVCAGLYDDLSEAMVATILSTNNFFEVVFPGDEVLFIERVIHEEDDVTYSCYEVNSAIVTIDEEDGYFYEYPGNSQQYCASRQLAAIKSFLYKLKNGLTKKSRVKINYINELKAEAVWQKI
jgi:hypothetical protein